MSVIKQIFNAFTRGPVYIVFFGLIFFGVGAGLTYQQLILEREGVQAQGEVINLVTNCDDEGCSYAPVVRFKAQDGGTISFESTYSSNPPSHYVGETVTVIYRLEAPEKADIKGEGQLFRIIFMSVGGIVIILGLGMFFLNLRNSFIIGIDPGVGNGAAVGPTGMMRSATTIYQGKTYTSVDDLPPEARAKVQKAMSVFEDKDGDGIPDILQGAVGNISLVQADQSAGVPGSDPGEKLRKLQQMLDERLITRQEYKAKKAEILSRM